MLAGTCTRPIPCGGVERSSRGCPCVVISIGRVCATAHGTLCSPTVRLTFSVSITMISAATNRSHCVSGSGPARSKNGVRLASRSMWMSMVGRS